MEPKHSHPWKLNESEAIRLQKEWASKVIKEDQLNDVQYVAGVDVAYDPHSEKLCAAVVVLDTESLQIVETAIADDQGHFPYIPGLFSFREIPPITQALKKLNTTPDLIVCDGQGIAHPRRFGLASHLGVLFDVPTIGCGKTKLIGEAKEPGKTRGDYAPLVDDGEVIGNVLRTQDRVKPIYISIGHRISLSTACDWIIKLSPRYRLPETTRQVDQVVRRALAGLR
ncbi:deoxyribonuclease V [Salinithrix halophila]|uniref:Endonuclease V n=1 Tax=Salinithrix halophila TaxID=1485204 RepID=A0ABV8JDV1_9BACL